MANEVRDVIADRLEVVGNQIGTLDIGIIASEAMVTIAATSGQYVSTGILNIFVYFVVSTSLPALSAFSLRFVFA